jgi:hypothetical protein
MLISDYQKEILDFNIKEKPKFSLDNKMKKTNEAEDVSHWFFSFKLVTPVNNENQKTNNNLKGVYLWTSKKIQPFLCLTIQLNRSLSLRRVA